MRSGKLTKSFAQGKEITAFLPNNLPFELILDKQLDDLHSKASMSLGRLDGLCDEIRNGSELFSTIYLHKEAAASSQVEGTMATFSDALQVEAGVESIDLAKGTDEIINYVAAMRYGIISELPFSKRLIKEVHLRLLHGVRGENKSPGEFKKIQNWIGGPSIATASFFPSPPEYVESLLDNLERFVNVDHETQPLVKAAMLHAQFENIHPFLDGNGRVGRLLVTLFLCKQGILHEPLLFLSEYFNENRREYIDRLDAFHEKDDIEGWTKFFLEGIIVSADKAVEILRAVRSLNHRTRDIVAGFRGDRSVSALKVLNRLYQNPFVSIKEVEKVTSLSYTGSIKLIEELVVQGILVNVGNTQRNKTFYYKQYLDILSGRVN